MTIAAMSGSATWLESNTWDHPAWTVDELCALKRGRRVSVVLPALDEEETVGSVVSSIMGHVGSLVDEIVVVDSGSRDATITRARAAGARVVTRESALPKVAVRPGKGEVLWRSLAVTSGDVVAFVDSDLIDPDPMYVPPSDRSAAAGSGAAVGEGLLPAAADRLPRRGRTGRRSRHRASRPAPRVRG